MLTLAKGWVAVNADGRIWFYNKKPHAVFEWGEWDVVIAGGGMARQLGHGLFTDLPVFNPDLPWMEHIVEVGGEETVVVKDEKEWFEVPRIAEDEQVSNGWVAQDQNESMFWYECKPVPDPDRGNQWLLKDTDKQRNCHRLCDSEVIFPDSWPWTQRIVRIVNNQIVRGE